MLLATTLSAGGAGSACGTSTRSSSPAQIEVLDAPVVAARFPDLDGASFDASGMFIPTPEHDELLLWAEVMRAYPAACQSALVKQAHVCDRVVMATVRTEQAAAEVSMRASRVGAWSWWQRVLVVSASVVGGALMGIVFGYSAGRSDGVTVVR